jgi:type 2A phosphatase activator TIP41
MNTPIFFLSFFSLIMSVNATSPVYIKEGTIREGLTQGIVLHDWKIISKKAPICSSSEMEK